MSKKKMPKRSVGGVYVCDMDKYLLEVLKKEHSQQEFLYAFRRFNSGCETQEHIDIYNEISEKINTLQYFIEKTKKKIKKNK
jgi:hypothetical protein